MSRSSRVQRAASHAGRPASRVPRPACGIPRWVGAVGLIVAGLLTVAASRPVQISFSPARPTVGDLITITFPAPVKLIPSREYEIVRAEPTRVMVRSFRPGPFTLRGKLTRGNITTDLTGTIAIASVLQPNDALTPADLKPPRPLPPNRTALISVIAAAVLALLSWIAVALLARRRRAISEVPVNAEEEFRTALRRAARMKETDAKLISLAEATRRYLAHVHDAYGRELTTFELLHRIGHEGVAPTLRELLTAADMAKFSPWGAEPRDYGYLVERLGHLPEYFVQPAEEEAA